MDRIINLKNKRIYFNSVMKIYSELVDRDILKKKDDLYLYAINNVTDDELGIDLQKINIKSAREYVEIGLNDTNSSSIMSLELSDLIIRLFDNGSTSPSFIDLSGQNVNLVHTINLTSYRNNNIPNVLFAPRMHHSPNEYLNRISYEILGEKFAKVVNEVNEKYDNVFSFGIVSKEFTKGSTGVNGYRFPPRFSFRLRAIDAALQIYKKKCIILTSKSALYSLEGSEYRNMLINSGLLEAIIEIPKSFPKMFRDEMCLLVFSKDNKNVKVINGNSYEVDNSDGHRNNKLINRIIRDYRNSTNVKSFEELTGYSNMSPSSIDNIDSNKFENSQKLSTYAEVFSGTQYTKSYFEDCIKDSETGYKLLVARNILDGEINYSELPNIDLDDERFSRFKKYGVEQFSIKEGDILISTKTSVLKICFVDETPKEKVLAAGGMLVVRPKDERCKDLLNAFFSSEKGINLLNSIVKGNVVKIITLSDLSNLDIPSFKEENKEAFENIRMINAEIRELKCRLAALEDYLKKLKNGIDYK